jgi:hypothetical protein
VLAPSSAAALDLSCNFCSQCQCFLIRALQHRLIREIQPSLPGGSPSSAELCHHTRQAAPAAWREGSRRHTSHWLICLRVA